MSRPGGTMRRFWDQAAVIEQNGGFEVRLDGKPMRLPGITQLTLSSRPVAEAIAAEWQQAGRSGGQMSFDDVPLTRLACTALARVEPNREAVAQSLAAYGQTDLLCYRAQHPQALVQRQVEQWQPWLDWCASQLGAPLEVAPGVVAAVQPPASLARLAAATAALDTPALTALGVIVPATSSLVLGLAVGLGEIDAPQAYRISLLDEMFQEEHWGRDAQAEERRERIARDVEQAGRYMALAR